MRFRRILSAAVRLCVSMVVPLLVLSSLASAETRLALSAEGKFAAYVREADLWVVSTVAGAKPRKVASVSSGHGFARTGLPRWSPARDRLAYYSPQSGSVQLWVYDPLTDKSRQISFVDGGVNPALVALSSSSQGDELRYGWSPDGSKIVFASQVAIDGAAAGNSAGAIEPFPSPEQVQAGAPIVLTNHTPHKWTFHGLTSYSYERGDPWNKTTLAMPAASPRPTTTQLFVLDVQSGKHSQLTHDAAGYFMPDWSPDGKQLAYMSVEGQALFRGSLLETNIFTFDLATGKKTKITQGRMQRANPRWSPDGKWIAYVGQDVETGFVRKDAERYVVRSDGSTAGNPRNLTTSIDRFVLGDAVWSPDGSALLTWYIAHRCSTDRKVLLV